jgi:peptidoglycan hydrolase CwlO-like protein
MLIMSVLGMILNIVFSAILPSDFLSWNSLLFFLLFILVVALVILYLLLVKYKNKSVFQEDDRENKIRDLQEMLISKDKEIFHLESKLKKSEAKWENLEKENEKLNRKNKNLEGQIKKSEMNVTTAKEDLIIQYYMNNKSVNQV